MENNSNLGGVLIGTKVFTDPKLNNALKMFDNAAPAISSSTTFNIPDTNSESEAFNRGQ